MSVNIQTINIRNTHKTDINSYVTYVVKYLQNKYWQAFI